MAMMNFQQAHITIGDTETSKKEIKDIKVKFKGVFKGMRKKVDPPILVPKGYHAKLIIEDVANRSRT